MEESLTLVSNLLERMGIRAEVEERMVPELSVPYVNVVTNDARLLIGARAETLAAFEYLARRLQERQHPETKGFFVDVNGYRLHRMEELKSEAKAGARRVRLYRTELTLKPMSAFERRIIHMALAEYPDIMTESVGEGRSRRVVIKPLS